MEIRLYSFLSIYMNDLFFPKISLLFNFSNKNILFLYYVSIILLMTILLILVYLGICLGLLFLMILRLFLYQAKIMARFLKYLYSHQMNQNFQIMFLYVCFYYRLIHK